MVDANATERLVGLTTWVTGTPASAVSRYTFAVNPGTPGDGVVDTAVAREARRSSPRGGILFVFCLGDR